MPFDLSFLLGPFASIFESLFGLLQQILDFLFGGQAG